MNNSLPLCRQPYQARDAGKIGFQQLASRMLIWLLLNHFQLLFALLVSYTMRQTGNSRLDTAIHVHAKTQKELLALAVFREDRKDVEAWHRVRSAVRSLAHTQLRRRIRVTASDIEAVQAAALDDGESLSNDQCSEGESAQAPRDFESVRSVEDDV